MKCTNCGYETQPGAKFCVQCGTTMISPTGIPAVPPPAPSPSAASVGAAPRPTAAAPTAASLSATMARAAAAAPPIAPRPPLGTGPSLPPLPAADVAQGRKTGLIVACTAGALALLVGGFFGYRMLFPDAAESTAAPQPAATTASPADAKEVSTAAPTTPAAADSSSVQQAVTPPPDEAKSTASRPPPDKGSPAPAGAVTAKTDSASVKPDIGKAAAQAATSTAAGSGAPDAARSVSGTPPAKTAAAAASGSQDRWQQMAEAMARCQREDFFGRVGCQQRVGRRFCEGYWGSVPQCPGGAPRDKAQ
jgi:hypothetical protein